MSNMFWVLSAGIIIFIIIVFIYLLTRKIK